jgi:TPR repeat protein
VYAQIALGRLYLKGEDVKPDGAKAFRWFKMASENGDPESQYWLSVMYELGVGVKVDKKESLRWLRAAAGGGYPEASKKLRFDSGPPKSD